MRGGVRNLGFSIQPSIVTNQGAALDSVSTSMRLISSSPFILPAGQHTWFSTLAAPVITWGEVSTPDPQDISQMM